MIQQNKNKIKSKVEINISIWIIRPFVQNHKLGHKISDHYFHILV